MRVGYVRVSTQEQNTLRQEELMKQLEVERIYIDKCTGKHRERPQLKEMLGYIREGDEIVVESISRLARNTRDLLEITSEFKDNKVKFRSIKEGIDTNTPTGEFMLTVFGAIAQLERAYILERQREGIEIAKKQGKYKGRKRIEANNFSEVYELWKNRTITGKKAQELLDMSVSTFYRRVKEYEQKSNKMKEADL